LGGHICQDQIYCRINTLSTFKIKDRNNYYVLREQDTTDPIREYMQKPRFTS
jgi:hypothetical protein